MTITVIGHLCIDQHHLPSGEKPQERFGGIMYSLTTLANLVSENDKIVPVFPVGKADYDTTMGFLRQYPNIDTSGVYAVDGETNRVMLFYNDNGQSRTECSQHIAPPIPWEHVEQFIDCDALLINMVSGFDITLETLDRIRMEIRGRKTPIHFDFHSLTLGVDERATRFRRPLPEWRRWCFMLNSIQMSEEEASGLTAERYDDATLVNQLMPLMVQTLLITRGARGVTLVQHTDKKIQRHDIPGVSAGETIDPTGCGDVFGAAFLYYALKTNDPRLASTEANRIAAWKATVRGPEAMNAMKPQQKVELPA